MPPSRCKPTPAFFLCFLHVLASKVGPLPFIHSSPECPCFPWSNHRWLDQISQMAAEVCDGRWRQAGTGVPGLTDLQGRRYDEMTACYYGKCMLKWLNYYWIDMNWPTVPDQFDLWRCGFCVICRSLMGWKMWWPVVAPSLDRLPATRLVFHHTSIQIGSWWVDVPMLQHIMIRLKCI